MQLVDPTTTNLATVRVVAAVCWFVVWSVVVWFAVKSGVLEWVWFLLAAQRSAATAQRVLLEQLSIVAVAVAVARAQTRLAAAVGAESAETLALVVTPGVAPVLVAISAIQPPQKQSSPESALKQQQRALVAFLVRLVSIWVAAAPQVVTGLVPVVEMGPVEVEPESVLAAWAVVGLVSGLVFGTAAEKASDVWERRLAVATVRAAWVWRETREIPEVNYLTRPPVEVWTLPVALAVAQVVFVEVWDLSVATAVWKLVCLAAATVHAVASEPVAVRPPPVSLALVSVAAAVVVVVEPVVFVVWLVVRFWWWS